jgi:hypothetical protein
MVYQFLLRPDGRLGFTLVSEGKRTAAYWSRPPLR